MTVVAFLFTAGHSCLRFSIVQEGRLQLKEKFRRKELSTTSVVETIKTKD